MISYLNDFIFCPLSIYFHKIYGNIKTELYQSKYQINGTNAHNSIDNNKYSKRKEIFQGIDIYSDEFKLIGKIDIYNSKTKTLIERKKKINKIYDGYIFQVYAQYYALEEMGYKINEIILHSLDDNKNYNVKLPFEDVEMDNKFRKLILDIKIFDLSTYTQKNLSKCQKCIYEPLCDRSMLC